MAKKNRELSVIEKGFIESKRHLTSNELHSTYFAEGEVSQEAIGAFLETLPPEDKIEELTKKRNPYDKDKTAEENRIALANSEMSAGNQMIRKHNNKQGVTAMTEAASELADVRRTVQISPPVDNSGHIHRIKKK